MIIRNAVPQDAAAMTALQNDIIRIGGTTAHEHPRRVEQVMRYIAGPGVISCQIAEDAGRLLGFQSIALSRDLPEGWGDIGTFVQPRVQARGIGTALFDASLAMARAAGLRALNATIRADNVPGLAYYARRGFADYAFDPDYALSDGRRVGRVSRRLDL